jgi:hypothetical protein
MRKDVERGLHGLLYILSEHLHWGGGGVGKIQKNFSSQLEGLIFRIVWYFDVR